MSQADINSALQPRACMGLYNFSEDATLTPGQMTALVTLADEDVTIKLPQAAECVGRIAVVRLVKTAGTNDLIVEKFFGGSWVDAVADTQVLEAAGDCVALYSDGYDWIPIADGPAIPST